MGYEHQKSTSTGSETIDKLYIADSEFEFSNRAEVAGRLQQSFNEFVKLAEGVTDKGMLVGATAEAYKKNVEFVKEGIGQNIEELMSEVAKKTKQYITDIDEADKKLYSDSDGSDIRDFSFETMEEIYDSFTDKDTFFWGKTFWDNFEDIGAFFWLRDNGLDADLSNLYEYMENVCELNDISKKDFQGIWENVKAVEEKHRENIDSFTNESIAPFRAKLTEIKDYVKEKKNIVKGVFTKMQQEKIDKAQAYSSERKNASGVESWRDSFQVSENLDEPQNAAQAQAYSEITGIDITLSPEQKQSAEEYHETNDDPLMGAYNSYNMANLHGVYREHGEHDGIDIIANVGTPIVNSWSGTLKVLEIRDRPYSDYNGNPNFGDGSLPWSYGNYLKLEYQAPDGETYYFIFSHLDQANPNLKIGGSLPKGTSLGTIGNSGGSQGAHMHFEVWTSNTDAKRAAINSLPDHADGVNDCDDPNKRNYWRDRW